MRLDVLYRHGGFVELTHGEAVSSGQALFC